MTITDPCHLSIGATKMVGCTRIDTLGPILETNTGEALLRPDDMHLRMVNHK